MDSPKNGLNVVNFVKDMLMDNGFNSDECSNFIIVTDEDSKINSFGKG